MPKFTRYYLTEVDAESLEAADEIFDAFQGFEPGMKVISEGASILRKPIESGVTVVVCVRDPDWDNQYEVFPGDQPGVEIFDIDLGRSDLSADDEYADWRESHMIEVNRLRTGGHTAAADHYQSVIDESAPDDFKPDRYGLCQIEGGKWQILDGDEPTDQTFDTATEAAIEVERLNATD